MPAPATELQKSKYIELRKGGHSQSAASEYVGLSAAWAKKFEKNATELRKEIAEARNQHPDAFARPLKPDELSDVARDCLEDFGRFRYRFFGRKSSPWAEEAANIVIQKLATPYKEYGVINAPPGVGKSTLFTIDIPAWVTCRSRSIRGWLGSSTQVLANFYTGRLRSCFTRTVPQEATDEDRILNLSVDAESTLIADYGLFRPDPALGAPWSVRNFTVQQLGLTPVSEKESTWAAFGKDAGFLGYRTKFIIWDDLFRREDMLGLNRVEKLLKFFDWYDDEAETRLEPGGLLLLQGQRLGPEDIYNYCKNKRTYIDEEDIRLFEIEGEEPPTEHKYFQIVYKAHYDEHCQVNATDADGNLLFDDKTRARMHSRLADPHDPANPGHGRCLLDPARLPYRELKPIMNKPRSNYRIVYQQEDIIPEDALVPDFFIDGGEYDGQHYEGCWDEGRLPGQIPQIALEPPKRSQVLSVITADPSPTRFWAIQWWIYVQLPNEERLMGRRYLIDQVFTPMGADDMLDYDTDAQDWTGLLVEWSERSKALSIPISHVIFEVNAAQKFVSQYKWFKRWFSNNGIKFKSHHTHLNKLDPKLGVYTIRSHYEAGRVRLPGTREGRLVAEPLYLQVTRYPEALYDDCVMAHWFLEFQLQFLVKKQLVRRSVYTDMPSWVNKEPSYG